MELAHTWRGFIGRINKDTLRLDESLQKVIIQVQEDIFCVDKCLWKSIQVLEILHFRITSMVFKFSTDQH